MVRVVCVSMEQVRLMLLLKIDCMLNDIRMPSPVTDDSVWTKSSGRGHKAAVNVPGTDNRDTADIATGPYVQR